MMASPALIAETVVIAVTVEIAEETAVKVVAARITARSKAAALQPLHQLPLPLNQHSA